MTYLVCEHELFLLNCERTLEAIVHVGDDFVQLLHILLDQFDTCELLGSIVDELHLSLLLFSLHLAFNATFHISTHLQKIVLLGAQHLFFIN